MTPPATPAVTTPAVAKPAFPGVRFAGIDAEPDDMFKTPADKVPNPPLLLFANVDIRHCESTQTPGELPTLALGYTFIPLGSHEEAREVSAHLGLPLPELNPGVVHHLGHA